MSTCVICGEFSDDIEPGYIEGRGVVYTCWDCSENSAQKETEGFFIRQVNVPDYEHYDWEEFPDQEPHKAAEAYAKHAEEHEEIPFDGFVALSKDGGRSIHSVYRLKPEFTTTYRSYYKHLATESVKRLGSIT